MTDKEKHNQSVAQKCRDKDFCPNCGDKLVIQNTASIKLQLLELMEKLNGEAKEQAFRNYLAFISALKVEAEIEYLKFEMEND